MKTAPFDLEAAKRGVPIKQALDEFIEQIELCSAMIAHNLDFDYPVLGAEMIRAGVFAANKPRKICTMKTTTYLCKLPGYRGYKWPKLEELHHHLFGTGFDGAHDALNDVRATARCFFMIKSQYGL